MKRKELSDIKIKRDVISIKDDKVSPIVDFLKEHYKIMVNRLDQNQIVIYPVSKKYEYTPTLDDISLHLMEEGIQHSDTLLRKIVRSPNQMKSFDPIADYFKAIKRKYEGKSHIDLLCSYITPTDFEDKEEKNYYRVRMVNLIRKWIVAAAACSLKLHPNDVALGFIQEKEGIGKTWLAKFLVPDDLKEYIAISETDKKKFDLRASFTNSFMILFDECIGLNNRTAEDFKATLSADRCKIMDKRFAFPVIADRVANAMFTSNNKTGKNRGFLTTGLGYRRFGCIAIDKIDFEYSIKVNVDQIWAEALMLIDQNFDFKFNQDDFMEFNDYNQRFKIETSASLIVKQNYEIPTNGEGVWLMSSEILKYLRKERKINADAAREVTPENIGEALSQLGFERKSKKIEGLSRYRYYVKPL